MRTPILAALCSVCVYGCAPPTANLPPLPWRTVTFGDGFSVDLPGDSTPTSTENKGPWGTSTTYTYMVTPSDRKLTFEFSYSDKTAEHVRKAGGIETFFENVELMRHAPSGGKKAGYNRKDITVSGLPGREFQIESLQNPGSVINLRVVAAANPPFTRIITMRITGEDSRSNSPEVSRFFDSLRIP
jgi:hypothetical protein